MITTEQLKALREETGISVMQCKKALEEAGGDMEKARRSQAMSQPRNSTALSELGLSSQHKTTIVLLSSPYSARLTS